MRLWSNYEDRKNCEESELCCARIETRTGIPIYVYNLYEGTYGIEFPTNSFCKRIKLNAVDLETGEFIGIPDHHVVQLVDAICRVLHYDQE